MPPASFQVIANPNAAGGKGLRVIRRLEEALRSLPESLPPIDRTRAPGHARELAREAAEAGTRRILVAGGDGTVHEVANGLFDADVEPKPALAVLPVGTGNDFHRMIRAPGGVEGALRTAREGRARLFDVGLARWPGGHRHFVNLAGVGLDVEVLRRRSAFLWLPGLAQYLGALGSALLRYRCVPLRVDEGGDGGAGGRGAPEPDEGSGGERGAPAPTGVAAPWRLEGQVLIAAVTVGPSVGGGFLVSPDAEPDDGLLDLFLVERLGLVRVLRYLPGVLRGTLRTGPEIHSWRIRELRLRSRKDRPFSFELDGEVMEDETRSLEIRVVPASLPVLELPEGSA